MGLKLKKIHKLLEFKQSEQRQSDFERLFQVNE